MFDAYHKWLGIPPKDQPPNHYRLLAIELFESDPDVIDSAANRQMAYVQQRAIGEHIAISQKLLNELSAARVCLLDPKRKAAYDTALKARLNPLPAVSPPLGTVAEATPGLRSRPKTTSIFRKPLYGSLLKGLTSKHAVLLGRRLWKSICRLIPSGWKSKDERTVRNYLLMLTGAAGLVAIVLGPILIYQRRASSNVVSEIPKGGSAQVATVATTDKKDAPINGEAALNRGGKTRSDVQLAAACFDQGLACEERGDHDKAITNYTEAIRFNPKYAEAYCNRGLVYLNKGDFDKAISDYTEAIRLKPTLDYAFCNRGVALDRKGEHDLAVADYSEAIRLNPEDAEAYYNRAGEFLQKGDFDRAITDYSQAVQLNATFADESHRQGFALAYLRVCEKITW